MTDLTTNYMGLRLKNPMIAGASPLSRDLNQVRRVVDAGAAAVVVYSLFQEQIEHDLAAHLHFEEFGAYSYAEALTYRPGLEYLPRGPHEYVEHVRRLKESIEVPVMASLNGTSVGGWIEYARMLEQAGIDGLELNIYQIAANPTKSAEEIEASYVDVLTAIKRTVSIPVALKLGPYITSLAHFASRLDRAGVDGLVLFNRFYQPDINLETLDVVPDLAFSARYEMRLPLRWIAILDPLVEASLAATTGVYAASDVIKLLMAGADAVQMCAALLMEGPEAMSNVLDGMDRWMVEHEYHSVHQMQGSVNYRSCSDPGAFERANYMRALQSFA